MANLDELVAHARRSSVTVHYHGTPITPLEVLCHTGRVTFLRQPHPA